MSAFPFNDIDGLLSQEDRVSLRDLAERCATIRGCFCEVGSFKGLSALCMLSQRSGIDKLFEAFDWFEDDKFKQFLDNLKPFWDRVVTHRGDFKGHSICDDVRYALCFVDHSHTVEDTRAAYEMFWPHISPGGILCFHDYNSPLYPEATVYLNTLPHKRVLQTSILAFLKE